MKFADRLRELREASGMTQEKLANAAGLSLGAVRNYEQGIREPYWQVVFKLASALGVSCEAFRDCIDTEPEPAPKRTTGKTRKRK
jgi:transcriptional regulator with XRE-family HTH domain